MNDRKTQVIFWAEFEEEMEEANGVRASGDSDAQIVASAQHCITGDCLADLVEEGHSEFVQLWRRVGILSLAKRRATVTRSWNGRVSKSDLVASSRLRVIAVRLRSW